LSGGEVKGFIVELKAIAEAVRSSNLDGFGATADRLESALADLEAATDWLLSSLAEGKSAEALSGATSYQRLFGLALTGCYLAKGGLARTADGAGAGRILLCRFAAENLLSETAALKDRIVNGAESLAAARTVLV
jgi:hypothetical protein